LAKENLTKEEINKLFLATDNAGRTFIDVAAESSNVDGSLGILNLAKENLIKDDVNKLLLVTDNAGRTVINAAAKRYNVDLFKEIFNWTKENLTKEEENKLLATDNEITPEGRSFMWQQRVLI
jgi:hypothetical protein